IRAVLEGEVLRHSIPRLTAEDLAAAAAIEERYAHELQNSETVSAWGRLNALYAGAVLPQFKSVLRTINNNGERYTRMHLFLTSGRERAIVEHRRLLDLSRARKVDEACALLDRHIRSAGAALRQLLETRRRPG